MSNEYESIGVEIAMMKFSISWCKSGANEIRLSIQFHNFDVNLPENDDVMSWYLKQYLTFKLNQTNGIQRKEHIKVF